jgi:hypothetical protein
LPFLPNHIRLPSQETLSILSQQSPSQSYVTTDCQSASLSWCQAPIWGLRPDLITVRQLRVCWSGAFSLMRERVCCLQLLLVLTSAVVLGSSGRGLVNHILLSQIRDSPNLDGQVPVFISLRNRVAQLYPQALGSVFIASYENSILLCLSRPWILVM